MSEESQVGKVWAGMKCEEEIMITIRLVSSLLFCQHNEICFPPEYDHLPKFGHCELMRLVPSHALASLAFYALVEHAKAQ